MEKNEENLLEKNAAENLTETQAELSETRELTINRLKELGLSEETILNAEIRTSSVTTVWGNVNGHKIETPIVDFDWENIQAWRGVVKIDDNFIDDPEMGLKLAKTMTLLRTLHRPTSKLETESIAMEQAEGAQNRKKEEGEKGIDVAISDIFR